MEIPGVEQISPPDVLEIPGVEQTSPPDVLEVLGEVAFRHYCSPA